MASGCGKENRVVASNTRDPSFKPSIINFYFPVIVGCKETTKIMETQAGNGVFKKLSFYLL